MGNFRLKYGFLLGFYTSGKFYKHSVTWKASVNITVLAYFGRLPYKTYFGGVSALSPEQYLKMNGFPNNYWGWGGEDDDIAVR